MKSVNLNDKSLISSAMKYTILDANLFVKKPDESMVCVKYVKNKTSLLAIYKALELELSFNFLLKTKLGILKKSITITPENSSLINKNDIVYITKRAFSFDASKYDKLYDLVVKTLTGKMVTVQGNDDMFVGEVHAQLESLDGTPQDQQRFICCGKQLNVKHKLGNYNISSESIVHLVLCLRGGMMHPISGRDGSYCKSKILILHALPDLD